MMNVPDKPDTQKEELSFFEQQAQANQHNKAPWYLLGKGGLPPLWPFVLIAVALFAIWGFLVLLAPPTKDNWHFHFCDDAHGGVKNICLRPNS